MFPYLPPYPPKVWARVLQERSVLRDGIKSLTMMQMKAGHGAQSFGKSI
jgi:hypothetical protein